MKRAVSVLSLLFAATLMFGCGQKAVKSSESQDMGKSQQQGKDKGDAGKGSEKITDQGAARIASKETTAKGEEITGLFKDILFDYDRYDVREEAKTTLKAVADYLIKDSSSKLLIEGHCDERGTSEYNLGLGDRRAKAVKDYLLSQGLRGSRIDSISYGKEKPVCTDHSDDCWAKNRRAHFVLVKPSKS